MIRITNSPPEIATSVATALRSARTLADVVQRLDDHAALLARVQRSAQALAAACGLHGANDG